MNMNRGAAFLATVPLVSPIRTWAVWIAILVAIGWAISQGMQAFLLAHPKPAL